MIQIVSFMFGDFDHIKANSTTGNCIKFNGRNDKHPWIWDVAGTMIRLIVHALLLMGNKRFGISANLRHASGACFPAGIMFFKYDWKELWNIFFAAGIVIGGP